MSPEPPVFGQRLSDGRAMKKSQSLASGQVLSTAFPSPRQPGGCAHGSLKQNRIGSCGGVIHVTVIDSLTDRVTRV